AAPAEPKPISRATARAVAAEVDKQRRSTTAPAVAGRAGEPQPRDARGRFGAGRRTPKKGGGGDGDGGGGGGAGEGFGARLVDRLGGLVDAVKGVGAGMDQADPSIAAANEV